MARPRIVIVGAGFAGYHATRTLSRLARGRADIALVNPTDYFLYLPHDPADRAGRSHRRCDRAARSHDFVVVGAGYTGTEVAAQGVLYTDVQLGLVPPTSVRLDCTAEHNRARRL